MKVKKLIATRIPLSEKRMGPKKKGKKEEVDVKKKEEEEKDPEKGKDGEGALQEVLK